jgi:hypothetical protein
MRVTILAFLVFTIFASGNAFGGVCGLPDAVVKVAPQPVPPDKYSSFRGIYLSSSPDHVRWQAQSLGFDTVTWHLIGGEVISAIGICADNIEIGRADYDPTGKMARLSLKRRFFSDKPIFVRKFADDMFEFYEVEPTPVEDDVCFQDVTCFEGVSKYGEQFLILRIGVDPELFVRR